MNYLYIIVYACSVAQAVAGVPRWFACNRMNCTRSVPSPSELYLYNWLHTFCGPACCWSPLAGWRVIAWHTTVYTRSAPSPSELYLYNWLHTFCGPACCRGPLAGWRVIAWTIHVLPHPPLNYIHTTDYTRSVVQPVAGVRSLASVQGPTEGSLSHHSSSSQGQQGGCIREDAHSAGPAVWRTAGKDLAPFHRSQTLDSLPRHLLQLVRIPPPLSLSLIAPIFTAESWWPHRFLRPLCVCIFLFPPSYPRHNRLTPWSVMRDRSFSPLFPNSYQKEC